MENSANTNHEQVKGKKSPFFYGYLVVPAAMLISLVSGGTTTLSYFVNGIMVNEGLIDSTVSGTATSIVSLCSVLFSTLCGMMHKKLGNKAATIVGFIVPIIGFAMLGLLPPSNALVIAGSFLYGFCLVTVSKIGTPTIIRKWFDLRAAVPTALVIASASMSSFLTKPISSLVDASSYRSGWFFIMGLCVIAAVVTLIFIHTNLEKYDEVPDSRAWRESKGLPLTQDKAEAETEKKSQDTSAMKSLSFWIFAICSLLRMGVYAGSNAYITIMILSRGFTKAEAGICLASLTLSSTVGRLATPVITKVLRISNQTANVLAHVIMCAGCALLVTGSSLGQFSIAIICMGFAYGLGFVSQTLTLGDMFPDVDFSTILGIFNTIVNCSFVFPIAVGIIGKAMGENYFPIYSIYAVINAAAAVVLFISMRKAKAA